MRKIILLMAVALLAANLYSASFGESISGNLEGNVDYSLDTITGTTQFTIPEIMNDDFAFYFNQDYCTNVVPYLHLKYESDEIISFDSIVLKTKDGEYRVGLFPAEGVHRMVDGSYKGVYQSYYQNDTAALVEAFEDPDVKISLLSRDGRTKELDFNYELNKEIIEQYKGHARFRGYF